LKSRNTAPPGSAATAERPTFGISALNRATRRLNMDGIGVDIV
jgi:hypothetical protein